MPEEHCEIKSRRRPLLLIKSTKTWQRKNSSRKCLKNTPCQTSKMTNSNRSLPKLYPMTLEKLLRWESSNNRKLKNRWVKQDSAIWREDSKRRKRNRENEKQKWLKKNKKKLRTPKMMNKRAQTRKPNRCRILLSNRKLLLSTNSRNPRSLKLWRPRTKPEINPATSQEALRTVVTLNSKKASSFLSND